MSATVTYPPCGECGLPMGLGQKGRHFMCDPTTSIGRACVCRPGCSKDRIGDRGICDPGCHPCHLPGAKLSKRNQKGD